MGRKRSKEVVDFVLRQHKQMDELNASEIARRTKGELGYAVTRQTIISILKKAGLSPGNHGGRRERISDDEFIIRYTGSGANNVVAAGLYGGSPSTYRGAWKRLGLKLRR